MSICGKYGKVTEILILKRAPIGKEKRNQKKSSIKLITMLVLTLLVVGAAHAETVKVMTFNIWRGGGNSLAQTITEIQNSGADIIGIQEPEDSLDAIAAALGFYSHARRSSPYTELLADYPPPARLP